MSGRFIGFVISATAVLSFTCVPAQAIDTPGQALGRVVDDVAPMKTYCVRYTHMKGPKDSAGRARLSYNTIHVRGGSNFARTRAHAKYGKANVRGVDRGGCKAIAAKATKTASL